MSRTCVTDGRGGLRRVIGLLGVGIVCALAGQTSSALTLTVATPDGAPVTSGYRYIVEEDRTLHSEPGAPALPGSSLAMSFHASYMPVVLSGQSDATGSPAILELPADRRYHVSVLPMGGGHTLGGALVDVGQGEVSVVVYPQPIPTAQISVLVFNDNFPINNAPDIPEEEGIPGATVLLFEAGGRYGASGGRVSQDAFGNPLGTTYNADGSVLQVGSGTLLTDANGELVIQNLYPGKYTLQVVPPSGAGWVQTATIEGTKGIDAWVKANEPVFFQEFGPPGYHVFVGFVQAQKNTQVLSGGATITGQIVNMHGSRPPEFVFYHGEPVPGAWVGLNEQANGAGRGIYAAPADDATGRFSIPDVPPGSYQLVVWDDNLDVIFAFQTVTVPEGAQSVDLLDVPVFSWFGKLNTVVFYDTNENGVREAGEDGIPFMNVNVRWRDGSLYQTFPTDGEGVAIFQEVFPFFSWLVAEVDYARLKPTGATFVVDGGGAVMPDDGWDMPSRDSLSPQEQCTSVDPTTYECQGPLVNPATGNNLSRTETGAVLTQAFQLFLSQTNVMEFGKTSYLPGENGGISGIVYYDTTRAEDDPRYNAPETWQPGIPRVQINLYEDLDADNVIDDVNGDGQVTLADVDNAPFNWRPDPSNPSQTLEPGPEDVDWNDDGVFDGGDAINIVTTDSWDDTPPTGCQGPVFYSHGQPTDCYDGLRAYNQIRPGVFDGGYMFTSYFPGGYDAGGLPVEGIPADTYIVEAVPPPGYEIVKEEDKNVTVGDSYTPAGAQVPPVCVGEPHVLPPTLSLSPEEATAGYDPADPGKTTPLCNRKAVTLSSGANAAADFFFFTYVPVAAHVVGFILNDLANEFDPNAPAFGEKFAPSWVPVSFQDWTGREVTRIYADEYGNYNTLVPSTWSVNAPSPSGVAPNMLTACMNHPGPITDTRQGSPTFGQLIEDPWFNRQYSQFCYTFQYMPGVTTYLDTPVVPVAAFAGARQYPLDCEYQSGTPVIYSASGPVGGPWVRAADGTQRITLTSAGNVEVLNPAWDGADGVEPKSILRDFGFGSTPGQVTVGGTPLVIQSWTNGTVVAVVPAGVTTGELLVTRGDNQAVTEMGVTLTVGGATPRQVAPGGSIQAVIDAAPNNALILVPPGIYRELVVMDRPLRLQGWGAASTIINAAKTPTEKLTAWRERVNQAINAGRVTLLPGQAAGGTGIEPGPFVTEEGPGIIVLAKNAAPGQGGFGTGPRPRIDGFTLTGGDTGGGIFVNGYAHHLQISNNRIVANQGFYHGGIRIGNPYLTTEVATGEIYVDSSNDDVRIQYNQIVQNGSLGGVGGGISLATGADQYRVTDNYICGNFSMGDGGGIGHYGLSTNGLIDGNTLLFNQSFNQGQTVMGGGLIIAGGTPLAGATSLLTPGSGSVKVIQNLIQGNLAGAGDGGGIVLSRVNGQDVQSFPNNPNRWYRIQVLNNTLQNNVSGLAGGAMSIQDALRVDIVQNTIVHNDSTATAGAAFTPGNPNQSNLQPGGIVSRALSQALYDAIGTRQGASYKKEYSNPVLINTILFENRSFYFATEAYSDPPAYFILPDVAGGEAPIFWDMAVLGTSNPASLAPQYCVLTDASGMAATNLSGDPALLASLFNGSSSLIAMPEVTTGIQAMPAFDEGGNFIDVRFGPLTVADPATGALLADVHLLESSIAIDAGLNSVTTTWPDLLLDIDEDVRPLDGDLDGVSTIDIGADEF